MAIREINVDNIKGRVTIDEETMEEARRLSELLGVPIDQLRFYMDPTPVAKKEPADPTEIKNRAIAEQFAREVVEWNTRAKR